MERLDDGVMNLFETRRRIEAREAISPEAGDFFFSTHLERLDRENDPEEMKVTYQLLKLAIGRGYDFNRIKEEYREVLASHRLYI